MSCQSVPYDTTSLHISFLRRIYFMEANGLGFLAAGIGAALTVIGAGLGIGKLAAAAMEASGRQPEVAGQVRTSMLIAAALIEGATFFALAICIILATKS
jgi:F-type H+-transporting ATPase subunit c